jgi:hypothetical protein
VFEKILYFAAVLRYKGLIIIIRDADSAGINHFETNQTGAHAPLKFRLIFNCKLFNST